MNVLHMFLQSIPVRRFLATIAASVVELFGSVILHMPIVGLQVSQEMPADFTTDSILSSSRMRFHVFFDGILCSESLRTYFTNFDVICRMSVILKGKHCQL